MLGGDLGDGHPVLVAEGGQLYAHRVEDEAVAAVLRRRLGRRGEIRGVLDRPCPAHSHPVLQLERACYPGGGDGEQCDAPVDKSPERFRKAQVVAGCYPDHELTVSDHQQLVVAGRA